jgi:heme/copper-type cytochrome/quinol oxidase subunit 2
MPKKRPKKATSAFIAMLIIVTSTAIGVLFADLYLATDRNSRAVRADISQVEAWFGGLDLHIVTIVVAVIILLAIAIYARNRA